MEIKIVAFDPALSNMGIAFMTYSDGDLRLEGLKLVQTDRGVTKQVRQNSDDLSRARLLQEGMVRACEGRAFAIAEIPTGTQSARGAMSNGIAIGVLASCPIPLIEVTPTEAKLAGPGIKTATKQEMIEWAINSHPHKDWLMRKTKGVMRPVNANEHLADAVAIARAGIRTQQFKQAFSMLMSMQRVSQS